MVPATSSALTDPARFRSACKVHYTSASPVDEEHLGQSHHREERTARIRHFRRPRHRRFNWYVGSIRGDHRSRPQADRKPTTTTTTEPPPEGVFIVMIDNGVLRPSNLEIDLDEIQVVRWINMDDREYVLEDGGGAFRSEPIGKGGTFEFDYSTLPTGLHRYRALLETDSIMGGIRTPGLVDTRPAQ